MIGARARDGWTCEGRGAMTVARLRRRPATWRTWPIVMGAAAPSMFSKGSSKCSPVDFARARPPYRGPPPRHTQHRPPARFDRARATSPGAEGASVRVIAPRAGRGRQRDSAARRIRLKRAAPQGRHNRRRRCCRGNPVVDKSVHDSETLRSMCADDVVVDHTGTCRAFRSPLDTCQCQPSVPVQRAPARPVCTCPPSLHLPDVAGAASGTPEVHRRQQKRVAAPQLPILGNGRWKQRAGAVVTERMMCASRDVSGKGGVGVGSPAATAQSTERQEVVKGWAWRGIRCTIAARYAMRV